jgi:hypothetical protein
MAAIFPPADAPHNAHLRDRDRPTAKLLCTPSKVRQKTQ